MRKWIMVGTVNTLFSVIFYGFLYDDILVFLAVSCIGKWLAFALEVQGNANERWFLQQPWVLLVSIQN